jgi:branched-chain amino acid transport system substrate-binding protein
VFNYPKYFSTFPTGPDPKTGFSKGFFDVAMAQNPKPKTIAIAAADAEFAHNAADGARLNAKAAGLQIVYDRTYPPSTVDYTPILHAIQATNPDLLYVGSYPLDSVGMVRAIKEVGLNVKLCCGGMVGLQYTAFKTQLGPLLNGIINYDVWLPAPTMMFPGIADFLKKYQERAVAEGVDPLGYYLPPFAYAQLQILGEAVQATHSLDQDKLADYIRDHTMTTVVGDLKFGKGGEWTEPRVLQIQFQDVKGNGVEQFKNPGTQVILSPKAYVSGKIIYPYGDANK